MVNRCHPTIAAVELSIDVVPYLQYQLFAFPFAEERINSMPVVDGEEPKLYVIPAWYELAVVPGNTEG